MCTLKESERPKEELKLQPRTGERLKNTKGRKYQPVAMIRWGHKCAFVAADRGQTDILDPRPLSSSQPA